MRLLSLFALICLLMPAGACTGKRALNASPLPVPDSAQPEPEFGGVPGLDELALLPPSPGAWISKGGSAIPGANAVAQSGSGNYVEDGALAIIPSGEDDLAYAVYTQSGITQDKPVSVEFTVEPAAIIPSGEDDLARFVFWIGLSNYTRFTWEWLGPFGDDAEANSLPRGASMVRKGTSALFTLPLNTEELRERYVSRADEDGECRFNYVVLATASGDPGLPNGVKVLTSQTATSLDYFTNKPHFVSVFDPFVDPGGAGASARRGAEVIKQASGAQAVMGWEHVSSIGGDDARNEAFCYQIRRQAVGSSQVDIVGLRFLDDFEGQSFRDPPEGGYSFPPEVDLPIPDPPVNGTAYIYMIKAFNQDGYPSFGGPTSTPSSRMKPLEMPIAAPLELRTDWLPPVAPNFDGGILVEWEAVEGAVSYDLYYRYESDSVPQLLGGGHTATEGLHTIPHLEPDRLIYYSVAARGASAVSPLSAETRGFAPDQTEGNGIITLDLGNSSIRFLYVPFGAVALGSPFGEFGHAGSEEEYQHANINFGFYISETEITNAMWQDFMDAGGYSPDPDIWFPEADTWRVANNITSPPYWGDVSKNSDPALHPNHPVLDVSWYEAAAFVNWAQRVWDSEPRPIFAFISLPSEREWEYAAEGPTAFGEYWLYPWSELRGPGGLFNDGDDGLDMARCNSVLDVGLDVFSGITSPAGSFPLGRSWCGALDMAGNVAEWTVDNFTPDYPSPHTTLPLDFGKPIVVRGGSFWDLPEQVRTSARAQRDVDSRGTGFDPDGVGVRLRLQENF